MTTAFIQMIKTNTGALHGMVVEKILQSAEFVLTSAFGDSM